MSPAALITGSGVTMGGTSGLIPEATAGSVTKKKPRALERSLTLTRWRPADKVGTVNKVENFPLRSARTLEAASPPNLIRSRRFGGKREPINRTVSPIGAAVGVQRTRLPLREAISPIDGLLSGPEIRNRLTTRRPRLREATLKRSERRRGTVKEAQNVPSRPVRALATTRLPTRTVIRSPLPKSRPTREARVPAGPAAGINATLLSASTVLGSEAARSARLRRATAKR
jgi:hypothetical protein